MFGLKTRCAEVAGLQTSGARVQGHEKDLRTCSRWKSYPDFRRRRSPLATAPDRIVRASAGLSPQVVGFLLRIPKYLRE